MKAFFAVIASGLVLASAPAVSASAVPGKSAAGEQSSAAKKLRSTNTRYCLDYEALTGSRISKRECKTKAQWAAEGINVEKLL